MEGLIEYEEQIKIFLRHYIDVECELRVVTSSYAFFLCNRTKMTSVWFEQQAWLTSHCTSRIFIIGLQNFVDPIGSLALHYLIFDV